MDATAKYSTVYCERFIRMIITIYIADTPVWFCGMAKSGLELHVFHSFNRYWICWGLDLHVCRDVCAWSVQVQMWTEVGLTTTKPEWMCFVTKCCQVIWVHVQFISLCSSYYVSTNITTKMQHENYSKNFVII